MLPAVGQMRLLMHRPPILFTVSCILPCVCTYMYRYVHTHFDLSSGLVSCHDMPNRHEPLHIHTITMEHMTDVIVAKDVQARNPDTTSCNED